MKSINDHIIRGVIAHILNPLSELPKNTCVDNAGHNHMVIPIEVITRFNISKNIYESLPNLIKK